MAKRTTEKINPPGDYQEETAAASKVNLDNLDFQAQVSLVLDQLSAISADIRARDQLKRDKASHPLAQIKLTTSIEARLQQTRSDIDVLCAIYERITSSKRYRKKYTDEEISKLEDTLRNVETQYNAYNASRFKRPFGTTKRLNVDLSSQANALPVTQEEQAIANESIQRWKQRDEHFDEQLQEIGEAVERIGTVAITIGEKASEQAKNAIETMHRVEGTTADISAVSTQIKRILKRQRRVECSIRIGLILTFLILLSVFIVCLAKFIKG
ncbi:hypothetical protein X943_002073 [Babesia divergens]|uniref:t-SNARE coiled-coil homology domain-containing protein n=1 Tax=Babesia divergens TaxID=32595 RepID=A0AAD9G771_BABDI|nr:hypothetical protein X943_002073 [Babesia divergens]